MSTGGPTRRLACGVLLVLTVQGCLAACAGDTGANLITQSQYTGTKLGADEKSLRSELGQGLGSGDIPSRLDVPSGDECVYYEDVEQTTDPTYFRFCFHGGVLVLKDGYGPKFDGGWLKPAS